MAQRAGFENIELHLIRVLHTLIAERSVSRAALRLHSTQPTVSAQLRRLRALTGDPLLVRSGQGMSPTATALQLMGPAAAVLREAGRLFSPQHRERGFEPGSASGLFRVAASDYLDPRFLPGLVAHLQRVAPGLRLEFPPLSGEFDYRRALATGEVDLVIGNWLQPPGELHLGRLLSDEVVCLMAADHPLARLSSTRGWTAAKYLAAEHVAPMPFHAGAAGVIDEHLATLGLQRRLAVRCAHFSLIPPMVAQSMLVLTTGRLFCSRWLDTLPLRVVRCPVAFPPLAYYQLWHDVTHASPSARWFREQVRDVARTLAADAAPRRKALAA